MTAPTLIDELINEFAPYEDADSLQDALLHAVRFQIDNAASYYYQHTEETEDEKQRKLLYDFRRLVPNIAPLAPSAWFEFGGIAKPNKNANNRYGILLTIDYDRQVEDIWYGNPVTEPVQWILRSQSFCKLAGEDIKLMRLIRFIAISKDGAFLTVIFSLNSDPRNGEIDPDENGLYNEELAALTAVCFAHCKGTLLPEHQLSRQVRRAAERTGKPIFSYHTIDIRPSTQALQTEGDINKYGLAKALHICRGHFAHYTEDMPLFGKYTGTFYRPMHTRGSIKNGISVKDYNIHPESEITV